MLAHVTVSAAAAADAAAARSLAKFSDVSSPRTYGERERQGRPRRTDRILETDRATRRMITVIVLVIKIIVATLIFFFNSFGFLQSL